MGIQPNKLHQRLPFPSLPTSQQHSHPHSFKNPHCHYIVLTPRIYLKAQLNNTKPSLRTCASSLPPPSLPSPPSRSSAPAPSTSTSRPWLAQRPALRLTRTASPPEPLLLSRS